LNSGNIIIKRQRSRIEKGVAQNVEAGFVTKAAGTDYGVGTSAWQKPKMPGEREGIRENGPQARTTRVILGGGGLTTSRILRCAERDG